MRTRPSGLLHGWLVALAACAPPHDARPTAAEGPPSTTGRAPADPASPRETPTDLDAAARREVERAERALADLGLDVPEGSRLHLACCVATSVAHGPIGVPVVWDAPLPSPHPGRAHVEVGFGLAFGPAPLGGGPRQIRRALDLDGLAAAWPARRARAERDVAAALAHASRLGRIAAWASRTLALVVAIPDRAGTSRVYFHARTASGDDETLEVQLDAEGHVTAAFAGPGRTPLP